MSLAGEGMCDEQIGSEHRDELMEDWELCRQRQTPKAIEKLR